MFEDILLAIFLFSVATFKIASVMAVNSDLKKNSRLSHKDNDKFKLFCENLKQEKKSLLVDKKRAESDVA